MSSKNESHLDRKLRQLGLTAEKPTTKQKYYFKLYFPRPPHEGVEYRAAKTKDGYNFVGLVLGHGGTTLQMIQRQTGTKIEIHDSSGNLNGAHPAPNDPSLHALVLADCKEKLEKGVHMIAEALEPVNTAFAQFSVEANGSAHLRPVGSAGGARRPPAHSQDGAAATKATSTVQKSSAPAGAPKQNPWGRQSTIPAAFGSLSQAAIPTPPAAAKLHQWPQRAPMQQSPGFLEGFQSGFGATDDLGQFSSNDSTDSSNASEHFSASDLMPSFLAAPGQAQQAAADWSMPTWGQPGTNLGGYSAFSTSSGIGDSQSLFPGGDLLLGGLSGWSPVVAPVLGPSTPEAAAPAAAPVPLQPEAEVDHLMNLLLQPQQL